MLKLNEFYAIVQDGKRGKGEYENCAPGVNFPTYGPR